MQEATEETARRTDASEATYDAWWAALDLCQEPVVLIDAESPRLLRANEAFRQLTDRGPDPSGETLVKNIAHQLRDAARSQKDALRPQRLAAEPTIGTTARPRLITAVPTGRKDGAWLVVFHERSGKAVWAHEATNDIVTGIADRRTLESELARRFASQRPFALVFIDLNGFKQVNDSMGHLAGDGALREVAGRLRGCLRESDLIGRFGGDEFVVLMDGAADETDLLPIIARIESSVSRPLHSIGGRASVTASVGWALSGDGYRSPRDMLIAADKRMYANKKAEN